MKCPATAGQCYLDISINNLANLQGKFSSRGQFSRSEVDLFSLLRHVKIMLIRHFTYSAFTVSTTYFIYSVLLSTVKMWRYALDKILIFGWGEASAQSVLEIRNPLNCPFNEVFN